MKKITKSKFLFVVVVCAFSVTACNRDKDQQKPPQPQSQPAPTPVAAPTPPAGGPAPPQGMPVAKSGAVALLKPASGSQVSGMVNFSVSAKGVRVIAEIGGLTPGKHGFHIHQNGDCSAPDALSAGEHFNPDDQQHGGHDSAQRHGGDLGNLDAGPEGRAALVRTVPGIALSGSDSIIGKAVLVHAGEDDLKTPPSGNSGARIACGVIEAPG